ncbi:MAG: ParB/RepB/Spo0J family partition protein [Shimia sp.]
MAERRKGLGRGLSALMADVEAPAAPQAHSDTPGGAGQSVPIELLDANPGQPRRIFREEDLDELTASIREKGIIQPLVVRVSPDDARRYQIIAGERRWRAAQRAQLHEVPVVVRDFNDTEVIEIAIVENVQRADLSPLEEAQAYHNLMETFGHTQDQVSKALGKSRPHIANMLRLLKLPSPVQAYLAQGRLTAGHARALLSADDPLSAADHVLRNALSVRETEAFLKRSKSSQTPRPNTPREGKDADTRALEADLSATLKMRVTIEHRPGNDEGGTMTIRYGSLDQLDDLCRALGGD